MLNSVSYSYMDSIGWYKLFSYVDDVNTMLTIFYGVIRKTVKTFIPSAQPKSKSYPVWINRLLIRLLRKKNKLREWYKVFRNPLDKIEIQILRSDFKNLAKMNECYRNYINTIEDNMKKDWKGFLVLPENKTWGIKCLPCKYIKRYKTFKRMARK